MSRPGVPHCFRRLSAGLAVAAGLLLGLEFAASLLPLDRYEPKFIDQAYPVFIPGTGAYEGRYVTSPHFKSVMNFQTFAGTKPPGVLRVFFLGGSAALGWPAADDCAATGYLRRALEKAAPGRYEIINAAAMSFGSHRVLDFLEDVVEMDPDLVVIWSGNNEYVERNAYSPGLAGRRTRRVQRLLLKSNLYRALRAGIFRFAPSLVRHTRGSDLTNLREVPQVHRGRLGRLPEIDHEVREHYNRNLAGMAKLLRDRGVPGVFCTVPVNLSAWAPYSIPPRFGDQAQAKAWNNLMGEGVDLLDRGDNRGAAARFEQALVLTPDNALAAYFEAQALQRFGEVPRARALFQQARDTDARPLRAFSLFNQEVRALAASGKGIAVIDLERALLEASGPNLMGMDLFYDYCHPTRQGHLLVARALLPALEGLASRGVSPGFITAPVIAEDCPPRDANQKAVEAYALGMTYGNNGLDGLAEDAYRVALHWRPGFSPALTNLGALLMKRGLIAEVENLSRRALEIDPANAGALFQLGVIRLNQRRDQEAADLFAHILAGNPQNPEAREALGDLAARRVAWEEAIGSYQQALTLGYDHALLRRKLGDAYRALGRTEEAAEQWRIALALDPLDEKTRRLLQEGRPAAGGAPR